jgi:hypothetical protein
MRDSRRLEDPSPARPEDAEAGATWRLIDRHNWKCNAAGKLEACPPEVLKDAKFEATRRSIAGRA